MSEKKLKLAVAGINYRTSTLFERELFQISRKDIPEALNYFMCRNEVEGIVILSTCNRIEFYFVLNCDVDPFFLINEYYYKSKQIIASERKGLFYVHFQSDAAKHLFTVISGLDSMVLGEYQIQGQIKDLYSIACSEKSPDKILHKLFHSAFRTGKMVRSKTKIGSGKQSVSGVAFQLINKKLKKNDKITIVGVNENTKIISEKLSQSGFSKLIFVNRTLHKATELAEKYNGIAFRLEEIEEPLSSSGCLFSCTGSPGIVISSDMLNKIYSSSNHPKLIIDMAVPRDVETINVNKNIEIYDLDSLQSFLDKQKTEISSDLPLAEKIISDETKLFEFWSESLEEDFIGPFVKKAERLRLQLLDETKPRISEDEFLILDKFSRSLLHRMKSIFNETVRTNQLVK